MKLYTRKIGTKNWTLVESNILNLFEGQLIISTYSQLAMYKNHEFGFNK